MVHMAVMHHRHLLIRSADHMVAGAGQSMSERLMESREPRFSSAKAVYSRLQLNLDVTESHPGRTLFTDEQAKVALIEQLAHRGQAFFAA